MPDIKIKPQMDQPKVRVVNNVPKDAGLILKKEYAAQQKEKQPDTKAPVQYATDRVETTGRRSTVAAADGMQRVVKGKTRSGNPKIRYPGKTLGTSQNPPEHFVQTGSVSKSIFKERARHKAIEDAKTTRPKTRNLAEKENIIVPRTSDAKVEGRQVAIRHPAAATRGTAAPKNGAPVPFKQSAVQRAKQMVQTKVQRKMLAQTAAKAKRGIKTGIQALAQGVMIVGRAAAAVVSSILAAGGGLALFLVLLVVIVIGAIAASPFGILFSEENTTPDTVPISVAVAQVRYDLNAQLQAMQTADSYHDITIAGPPPNWAEILAVFAVKVAGTDSPDAADVVTIDADRIARLKTVFWDMHSITPHVETTYHPDSDSNDDVDDSWTEKDLTITISAKTISDMVTVYGFTEHQITALDELLQQRDVLLELTGNLTAISAATSKLLNDLPEDLTEDRKAVVQAASSLVGKVNYFWGGKSLVVGWDGRWGTLQKVWAEGNSTTGTYRPYGLDCSGFVDWVFYNVTDGEYVIGHGGGVRSQHSYCQEITWDEAQIGDLAFYPDDSHVGIVAGWNKMGDVLIIHCSAKHNNVVITKREDFDVVARVIIKGLQ